MLVQVSCHQPQKCHCQALLRGVTNFWLNTVSGGGCTQLRVRRACKLRNCFVKSMTKVKAYKRVIINLVYDVDKINNIQLRAQATILAKKDSRISRIAKRLNRSKRQVTKLVGRSTCDEKQQWSETKWASEDAVKCRQASHQSRKNTDMDRAHGVLRNICTFAMNMFLGKQFAGTLL